MAHYDWELSSRDLQDFFEEGEYIVREGQVGDTFYIIADGSVAITQKLVGHDEPQQIRTLTKGSFFGEKALLTEERRTASVMALGPGVELLALNREYVIYDLLIVYIHVYNGRV